jgi:1,4-dihydroxy-2-naphthoate octaprenyltransferase
MNVKVWAQALQSMPRLSPQEWRELDPFARWLTATRASVLFMTLTAAALAGLLAARDGMFSWAPWLACTLGLLLAHATNNLLNDYTDSRRGIDRDNYYRNRYGVHVLEDGLLTLRQFWTYVACTGGPALLIGAWLVLEHGGLTLELMLAGAFFVLFYTWPLKYYGLGEPAVMLVWGPLMVGGTYYVITGQWSWQVTWLSLLFALGPTTVLFGKHIDKLDLDQAKSVHTLPVILGESRARRVVIALLGTQYLLCLALVASGWVHWVLLIVFINLPGLRLAINTYRLPKPDLAPEGFPDSIWPLWFSAFAFDHTRKFTSLFILGLLADLLLIQAI